LQGNCISVEIPGLNEGWKERGREKGKVGSVGWASLHKLLRLMGVKLMNISMNAQGHGYVHDVCTSSYPLVPSFLPPSLASPIGLMDVKLMKSANLTPKDMVMQMALTQEYIWEELTPGDDKTVRTEGRPCAVFSLAFAVSRLPRFGGINVSQSAHARLGTYPIPSSDTFV